MIGHTVPEQSPLEPQRGTFHFCKRIKVNSECCERNRTDCDFAGVKNRIVDIHF